MVQRLVHAVCVVVAAGWCTLAVAGPIPYDMRFEVPPALKPQVDFWTDVFTVYSRRQVAIHDTERLDRVYRVLDFRPLEEAGYSEVAIEVEMKRTVARETERVRNALLRLDRLGARHPDLTEDEKNLARLFRSDRNPRKFLYAAAPDRLRSQTGLRERFAEGIAVGHRYFPEMERIFREEDVPVSVTRLPLVESCFNLRAYSKVGASGIWQFMPSTARHFMRIDDAVDERLDPIVSTRAAARFLRQNYARLGTWPLALVAYNHGPGGLARAVNQLGTTDISTIIGRYQGPSFKFASRNFYPEFLAALDVESNHLDHYGPLPLHEPVATETVRLPSYVSLRTAATCGGHGTEAICDLNPALLPAVRNGKRQIPRGYELRLPAGAAARFERCLASAALEPELKQKHRQKPAAPARRYVVHRVRRGQTLVQIARRYGSTVDQIRRRNGLRNHVIREGQVLQIPTG